MHDDGHSQTSIRYRIGDRGAHRNINENRLKVLCLLLDTERTVTDLGNQIGLAQSPLSQHLAKLRKLELVGTRRDGQLVYYHLRSDAVRDLLALLKELYPK